MNRNHPSKFAVPSKAVRHIEDLQIGEKYWEVNGSSDVPKMWSPFTVLDRPCTQSQHDKMNNVKESNFFSSIENEYFFDCMTHFENSEHKGRHSCRDLNIGTNEDSRYNNNWIFKSKEDAEAGIREMQGIVDIDEILAGIEQMIRSSDIAFSIMIPTGYFEIDLD